ncbi:MAG: MBL fold metallo-hydrolase [Planctomycetota bacterium]|nr:MAG: MBL fold metallo-hydrolase [Planctomycetota bacterium]REJ89986.1 MAG: MBL fold metallo-hydrolase [Planctomycetota bacterium]REK28219.1 MAG: MBL fold metallo-hydrolase [Planctomycetota bacterium]REK39786.1 MAG: MBL fold metallo-hydrolase [Planctomycetota bacterium]
MRLLLLGTTGYHPNDERHTACMMLPEVGIVLDAGTAMFRIEAHLATDQLDIFLSHAHADHIVGLTYLLGILHRRPVARVRVHGLAEKLLSIDEHLFAEAIFPVRPEFEWVPLAEEVTLAADGRLTHFPLVHPGGSRGYRLDWPGHSLAYVTDTTARPDADYLEHIRGVDLLVHECYFPDGNEELAELTGHSCTTPVAELAREAKVGRLVLVHMDPSAQAADPVGLETARAIFPETILGSDQLELEF